MKRLFQISRYPGIAVFAIAGLSLVIFGFATYNLLHLSMANLAFIRKHGWLAVEQGALVQLLQILVLGAAALAFFVLFKICESELVIRYRNWQDR
ncbi:hypothetical protein [Roseovarius sp. Pro17]|uniref:hypothetical protein n=1 Tax=Roseovarius sp. Pro17 TaxID=3108175 RepID=UPI002D770A45|nr:hypothetical protein [Roseovarius sp. Pro17]